MLVAHLAATAGVREVVALDASMGELDGITWRLAALPGSAGAEAPLDTGRADGALARALAGVDVVLHVGAAMPSPGREVPRRDMVRAVRAVLAAAVAAGVPEVALVTSAMIYGALPSNPVPLAEDAPMQAALDDSVVSGWLAIERIAAEAAAEGIVRVSCLRPAALVGPNVDTVITRHFDAPRLLVVRESRPRWQFCHVEDLVAALVMVALGQVTGVLSVGCEGWLEQDQVERLSGMARVELPAALAFATASRLHRMRVLPSAGSDLAYVVHPWVVPSTRLLEAGWRPRYDNVTAFGVLLNELASGRTSAERRAGRRDATMGAAGAAVAVVGTAALVRAARRTRQR